MRYLAPISKELEVVALQYKDQYPNRLEKTISKTKIVWILGDKLS
jgi:hypothetical protein